MDRTKLINIMAALSLTSIVILTFIGFSFSDRLFSPDSTTPEAPLSEVAPPVVNVDPAGNVVADPAQAQQAQIEALQNRNAEMEALLEQMVQREVEYQNRLQEANGTILNNAPAAPAAPSLTQPTVGQDASLQAYQAQNEQLREAVAIMQTREAEYQAQLAAANAQRQQAPPTQPSQSSQPPITVNQSQVRYDDDRDYEGLLNAFPANWYGEWLVDNQVFVADERTLFKQEDGPFTLGRCVDVEYIIVNNVLLATEIETEDDCH